MKGAANGLSTIEDIFFATNTSEERVLFLSVILQALLDATKPAYPEEPENAILERDQARAWFASSVGVTAKDFIEVCELAGVDPSYTKGFAYKVLESEEVPFIRKRINALLRHS